MRYLPLATLLIGAVIAGPLQAKGGKLTPQDYFEIQELSARYAIAIDQCTNSGYDYADLYTPDGTFGTSEKWGDPGRVRAKGRDALAVAAGGGPNGCKDPKTYVGYGINHVITNQIIEARPDGVWGRNKLIAFNIGNDPYKNEVQGGYEDHYVKTAKGWRFKSRVHVFNMAESLQFGPQRQRPAAVSSPAQAPAGN